MTNPVANASHKHSKTRASFNALPESFTLNDVETRFGVTHNNAKVIATRFVKEGLAERVSKGKYNKLSAVI